MNILIDTPEDINAALNSYVKMGKEKGRDCSFCELNI